MNSKEDGRSGLTAIMHATRSGRNLPESTVLSRQWGGGRSDGKVAWGLRASASSAPRRGGARRPATENCTHLPLPLSRLILSQAGGRRCPRSSRCRWLLPH